MRVYPLGRAELAQSKIPQMNSATATSTALLRANALPDQAQNAVEAVYEHIQDGRFQRSLSLVAAASSFVSGLEVAYEHYKGSYSNPVMYSPVILSGAVTGAACCAFFSRRAAETALRVTSAITLPDGIIGFGFHIRGIYRKPGGWRLPITNIIMGPPLFAPLLFGTAAYLGLMASYLRREEQSMRSPVTAAGAAS